MWRRNLVGPNQRLFADPEPGPDEEGFQVKNVSKAYYESPYYELHKTEVQAVPTGPPARALRLEEIVGPQAIEQIEAAKKISFHAVGDTGAAINESIAKSSRTSGCGPAPAGEVARRRRASRRLIFPAARPTAAASTRRAKSVVPPRRPPSRRSWAASHPYETATSPARTSRS